MNYYTENIREISADIPSPEDMLMSSAFKEYYSNEVPIEQVYAQYNITPTI